MHWCVCVWVYICSSMDPCIHASVYCVCMCMYAFVCVVCKHVCESVCMCECKKVKRFHTSKFILKKSKTKTCFEKFIIYGRQKILIFSSKYAECTNSFRETLSRLNIFLRHRILISYMHECIY